MGADQAVASGMAVARAEHGGSLELALSMAATIATTVPALVAC